MSKNITEKNTHTNKSKIQKLSISKIKKIQQWQNSQKSLLANWLLDLV